MVHLHTLGNYLFEDIIWVYTWGWPIQCETPFPESGRDALLLDGMAMKQAREQFVWKALLSFICFSLQISLRPNPKSDSHGYALLLEVMKKLNRTRKQIQTEGSARKKINSLIRKQEGLWLRAKLFTPGQKLKSCF